MTVSVVTLCLMLTAAPSQEAAVDFDTQIMPVFSVAGCNAASCHGAATGQAGFHLSLFGGDPAGDYRAIVRELEGRRVNFHAAWESLLLQKATGEVEHGGEQRFASDSPAAALIQDWIRSGAPRQSTRRLQKLRVTPTSISLAGPSRIEPLSLTATFDDGSERAVETWATYWSSDEAALQRLPDGGYQLTRPGRYSIFVRFLSQIVTVSVSAPFAQDVAPKTWERNNWIDDCINDTLTELHIPPADAADDATFLRRVHLDLTGRLPTVEQCLAFLADDSSQKRDAEINRLLASEEFVDFWTYQLSQWLRFHIPGGDQTAANRLYAWLRQQVAEDRGWNQIARELVLATGDSHQSGAAAFHRLVTDARLQAEYFSEVMLGVRLRCANCHNHPLDRWTQDDYHGLAQVFAPIQRGQVVGYDPRGHVLHPGSGQPARAKLPGEAPLSESLGPRESLEVLTDWLVADSNPFFAQAMVGRIWRSLMGSGLIDPVDDTRATNPPSDRELLSRLTRDFVDHGYRWRHTLREICRSAAYQRQSVSPAANPLAERYYARMRPRPLSAEVMADAIADVTGISDFADDRRRTIQLVDPGPAAETLRVLGRCDFQAGCLPESSASNWSVATRLHLINGPLLNERLRAADGIVSQQLEQRASDRQIVHELFLRTLSRPPGEQEVDFWTRELAAAAGADERRRRVEDFLWSLLNCRDFITNH